MNLLVTGIYFLLTITWSLAYCCGKQWNRRDRKCRQINDDFGGHGDAAVRRDAHRPMEHIQGFNRSHWMLPSTKCSHHIAPAAAMVKEFEWNTQNTNETQLLASNYGIFWSLVVCENFNPKTDPLPSSSMRQASFKCEMPRLELTSSQTFLAVKRCKGTKIGKVIKQSRSSIYELAHIYAPLGVFLFKLLSSQAAQ